MRMIQAIIRPTKIEDVKRALDDAGYPSLTSVEVKGRGRQKGIKQMWRGEEYTVDMIPKVKIEIVVAAAQAEQVVAKIREAAYTGKIGDGKIFVQPVEQAVRVRTGETGTDAV